MNNNLKIKAKLKTNLKKDELEKLVFFIIQYDSLVNKDSQTFKITKNQYLESFLSSIINKSQIKFPLEIKEFKTKEEICNYVKTSDKSKPINLLKINNYIFLGKKSFFSYTLDSDQIFYKLNRSLFGIVMIMKMLKHKLKKEEISESK